MKSIPTYTVDSFTTEPFNGNPAGVCLLEDSIENELMLSIAQELNLSETAFIHREGEKYRIRYFSPIKEIPLCGHATLAAAKILFEINGLQEVLFCTHQGVDLHVRKMGNQIAMEFPYYNTTSTTTSNNILNSLKINRLYDSRYNKENNILMLVIDKDELISLQPDYHAMLLADNSISGVLVTSQAIDSQYDFMSRYFWPWSGGNEDPVTGATHTFMAPYWAKKLNKSNLKSFQASKRTGFMEVEVHENTLRW